MAADSQPHHPQPEPQGAIAERAGPPADPAPPAHRPRLVALTWPILAELLLGVAVAAAGLWLASQASDRSAAAYALANQVQATFFILFRVIGMGVSVVITQSLGAGQAAAARATALASLSASTWLGVGSAAVVGLAAPALLHLLNAPADVVAEAAPFLRLLALGLLLDAFNATLSAVLRAHLRTRDALYNMLAMHALHLVFSLLLMRGAGPVPALGLAGFAVALALSRAFGLALHLLLWRWRFGLVPAAGDWWRLDWQWLRPMLKIGVPGAAESLAWRLAMMSTLTVVGGLGTQALAVHGYVMQVMTLVLLFGLSLGFAAEILVGHLVGARRLHEAHRLVRRSLGWGLVVSTGLALCAALAARPLMQFFTRDEQIIATAQQLLWVAVVLEPGRTFNLVVINALRATGDASFPVLAGVVSMVLVMAGGAWLLGHVLGLGMVGVWIAYAADEWVRGLTMAARWWWRGWLPSARATHRALVRSRGAA